MTIIAKNVGRIDVWPTYDIARDADTAESKYIGRLTVWNTRALARANLSHEEEGEGGELYVAGAVHFDGATWLNNASLSCTDTPYPLVSYWVKTSDRGAILTSDPEVEINNLFNLSHTEDSGKAQFEFGDWPFDNFIEPNSDPVALVTNGTWRHCLCHVETNHPADAKIHKVYIDDVDETIPRPDNGDSFSPAFNGLRTTVGTDLDQEYTGDIADFQLYLLGSSRFVGGDIPEATRRLFIDASGKPVNPTVAAAELGTPVLLFSGDATGFATNQGSGGAFTVEAGALTNASTSPSD